MSQEQQPGERKPEGGNPGDSTAKGGEKSSNPKEWPKKKPEAGELSRETGPNDPNGAPPPKDETVERLMRDRDDLTSNDDKKRKDAEEKFDDLLGKKNRENLQQNLKDAKEGKEKGNPGQQQQAEKNADELTKKAAKNEEKTQPTKEDIDRARQKAEDLASDDKDKREAAEKEFDNAIGKDRREQLQKAMNDAKKGGNPEEQKTADQKADELTKKAAQNQKSQPSKEEIDRAKQKAEDLASDDKDKRDAAEKELDKQIGKDKREELQKAAKDAKSGDMKTKQAGEQKLDELAKEAAKDAKKQGDSQGASNDPMADKGPSKEDIEKLAQQTKDLASDDKVKREAAEKELDKQIGKDKREELQQAMKDLQSGDPKKAEEAQKKLEEMANAAKGKQPGEDDPKNPKLGGNPGKGQDGKPLEDDPKNRLKTAELRLKELEKNRYNTELQKKLGYTQEEYDRFLNGYRESVNQQRNDVEQLTQTPAPPRPVGPATVRVGEGGKVDTRPNGATVDIGSVGPSAAPPGFTDAQRKFAEEAAKLRRQQANP